jgi:hypothetical protein
MMAIAKGRLVGQTDEGLNDETGKRPGEEDQGH